VGQENATPKREKKVSFKSLVRESLPNTYLASGDSIRFTVKDDNTDKVMFAHTHTANNAQSLNVAEVLEFEDEFEMKNGYSLVVGEDK
jgi:hypothetical protein